MNVPSSQVSEPMEVLQSAPAPEEPSLGVDIFQAPPPPTTVMEALQQRLVKYKSEVEKANESENTSKARRMGRIVKQYEEAITAHKRGKPIAFDELPTPPGFAPIPGAAAAIAAAAPATPATPVQPQLPQPVKPSPVSPEGAKASHSSGSINRGSNKPSTKLTLQEKQLAQILQRQKQFKEAALNAKQRGDIDQARELLRTAKGFDKLIETSKCGLPVDMATVSYVVFSRVKKHVIVVQHKYLNNLRIIRFYSFRQPQMQLQLWNQRTLKLLHHLTVFRPRVVRLIFLQSWKKTLGIS